MEESILDKLARLTADKPTMVELSPEEFREACRSMHYSHFKRTPDGEGFMFWGTAVYPPKEKAA